MGLDTEEKSWVGHKAMNATCWDEAQDRNTSPTSKEFEKRDVDKHHIVGREGRYGEEE